MDEKGKILKFISTSEFRHAPNPAKYIMKGYVRKTKSSITWDDFLRIIYQLEKEGHLQKSCGLHGEDRYFLTFVGRERAFAVNQPIQNIKTKNQNSLWLNASRISKWAINNIIQIVISLIAAYLIYRFGWN